MPSRRQRRVIIVGDDPSQQTDNSHHTIGKLRQADRPQNPVLPPTPNLARRILMSQHSLNTDVNVALAALGSTMKGPSAPPVPLAGMLWLDDSASLWAVK